jgi:hypothetical protein
VGFALPTVSVPTEGIPDYGSPEYAFESDPELEALLAKAEKIEMDYIIKE